MANYIFSYDLNEPRPTPQQMDDLLKAGPWSTERLLETVWHIGTGDRHGIVVSYLRTILPDNQRFVLVDANELTFRGLLVEETAIVNAWARHE